MGVARQPFAAQRLLTTSICARTFCSRGNLWTNAAFGQDMQTDHRKFALIVGGIVVLAALALILSGGEWGGKTTVEGDQDLPPVADMTR